MEAKYKKSAKCVAIKRCGYKKDRIGVGESVPADWPESAISMLLSRNAIKYEES